MAPEGTVTHTRYLIELGIKPGEKEKKCYFRGTISRPFMWKVSQLTKIFITEKIPNELVTKC